jgi:hypothetical protein
MAGSVWRDLLDDLTLEGLFENASFVRAIMANRTVQVSTSR